NLYNTIRKKQSALDLNGIENAKNYGNLATMTGNGADDLFAGYNYLSRYYSDVQKLNSELCRLWQVMHFSSKKLGKHVGVEVKMPFLDEEFAMFAKSISASEKVGEDGGKNWGKIILIQSLEPTLWHLVWQT